MRYKDLATSADGFFTPEIGPWAEEKYRLFWGYADLFANSMKRAWHKRVFIDLFCGAGKSRVEGTSKILLSSPLLALQVSFPFDQYIFCDKDMECIKALKSRIHAMHTEVTVVVIHGDANIQRKRILDVMPPFGPKEKVLGFCFADPFRLRDLHFLTIKTLSTRFMDFLIHIPAMDPLRNQKRYLDPRSKIMDQFMGTSAWRDAWGEYREKRSFDLFVADYYCQRMKEIGYKYGGLGGSILIRSREKNLPLYRLGFFSRNELGGRFWREIRRYSDPQLKLF